MARQSVKTLLEALAALSPDRPFRVMNVCGGHERTITHEGLRSLLGKQIELIPGPGYLIEFWRYVTSPCFF